MSEETFLTGSGECMWAKVFVPDKKYKDFGIDVIFTPEAAKEHIDRVRNAVAQYPNRAKILQDYAAKPEPHPRGGPVKGMALPPWLVLDDGNFQLKFRSDSEGGPKDGPKFKIVIDLMDARLNPWPRSEDHTDDVLIGNGSIVKVCYYIYAWNNATQGGIGVTLRLKAVQVIDHVPYEREDNHHGFIQEEGTDMGSGHGFSPETSEAENSNLPVEHSAVAPVADISFDDIPY